MFCHSHIPNWETDFFSHAFTRIYMFIIHILLIKSIQIMTEVVDKKMKKKNQNITTPLI